MIDRRISEYFQSHPTELTSFLKSLGLVRTNNSIKQGILKALLSIGALQTETGGDVNIRAIAELFDRDPNAVRSILNALTSSGNLEKIPSEKIRIKAYVAKGFFKEFQFKLLTNLQILIFPEVRKQKNFIPMRTDEEIFELMAEMYFTRFDSSLKQFKKNLRTGRGSPYYNPIQTMHSIETALTEVETLEGDEDFPKHKIETLQEYRKAFLEAYRDAHEQVLKLTKPDLSGVNHNYLD